MLLIRLAFLLAALVLAGLIVWAMGAGDAGAAFGFLLGAPWGIVTSVDLYLGFAVSAALILLLEPRWWKIPLVIALFFLGNVLTALWLAARLPVILDRLKRPA